MTDNPKLDQDMQPVPYEDGDHCAFFAIQEASLFFNKQPLTRKELMDYQAERTRRIDITEKVLGNIKSYHWLTISLRFVASKLETKGISISNIFCAEDTKNVLEKDGFVKRSGIPISQAEENGDIEIDFPALIFTSRPTESHVWCCISEEKFDQDYGMHIGLKDSIVLVARLEKQPD